MRSLIRAGRSLGASGQGCAAAAPDHHLPRLVVNVVQCAFHAQENFTDWSGRNVGFAELSQTLTR